MTIEQKDPLEGFIKSIKATVEEYNQTHCVSVHEIKKIAREQYEQYKKYDINYRTWMAAFDVANKVLCKTNKNGTNV